MAEPRVIHFGKYKGVRVDQVLDRDPGYLKWLLQQDWLDSELAKSIKEHMEEGYEPIIPFGKYKGEYARDVAAEDPHYAEWLLGTDNLDEDIRECIEEILYS